MDLAARLQARTSPLDGLAAAHPMLSAPQPWRLVVVHAPAPTSSADAAVALAPGRWLVVHEEPAGGTSGGAPPAGSTSPVDVTDGMTRVRVSGARSRLLLATGISLDLHPEAFPAGHSAATAYRTVAVVLHARDEGTFDLYAPRSQVASLWTWLADAATGLE